MRRALAFLVVGLVLVGCGSGSSDGISPPPPPPPPPPPNTVAATNYQFSPASLTITHGTTVTWTIAGGPHTVTFEDNQGSSADVTDGATHTRTFNNVATIRYRCLHHSSSFTSGMTGSIIVQ